MALATRHSGFQNVTWCGLTLNVNTSIDWNAQSSAWDLTSDDSMTREGVIPVGLAGEITLTGRKIGGLALTYWGRTSDMVVTILNADDELGITGDILTLKDSTLVGIDNRLPTDNVGERSLRFSFSSISSSKEIFSF